MSAVYPAAATAFLRGQLDVLTDVLKLQPVDATYTYSPAHDFLSDIAGGARIGPPVTLTGTTVADGELFCDDMTTAALPAGDTVTALVLYQDTGAEATSPLIAHINRAADYTPIALDTNGGQVELVFPGGQRLLKI